MYKILSWNTAHGMRLDDAHDKRKIAFERSRRKPNERERRTRKLPGNSGLNVCDAIFILILLIQMGDPKRCVVSRRFDVTAHGNDLFALNALDVKIRRHTSTDEE